MNPNKSFSRSEGKISAEEARFIRSADFYRSVPNTTPSTLSMGARNAKAIQTRKTTFGESTVSKTGMANLKAAGLRKMLRNSTQRQAVSA